MIRHQRAKPVPKRSWVRNTGRTVLLAIGVVFVVFACAPAEQNKPDQARPALRDDEAVPYSLMPDSVPLERVSSNSERGVSWRDAVLLEAGTQHTFELTDVKPWDEVRIGLRESDGTNAPPINLNIHWSDGTSERRETNGSGTWQDLIVTRERAGDRDENGTLTIASESDFWLTQLEVVPYARQRPHVIVLLIDTLRQDHLHCYGYARETSPNIDAFREDAVLFTGLVPPTSWTRPSVASLLTSTYPGVHGVRDRGDRVRENVTWLADVLEDHQYETHAILTNPNCIPVWGFGIDFDRAFEAHPSRWRYEDTDAEAIGLGIDTIAELGHRPYFMYLHAMAPHAPYSPPEPFRSQFAGATHKPIDLYDGEIAYFDSLFGDFIAALKNEGVYESSLIVVLSDHGEEFMEHGGTAHGRTLYEEQLRVPFLVKLPDNAHAGERWDGLLEMVDVAPTILDILDIAPPSQFQGASVKSRIGTEPSSDSIAYAELHLGKRSMRATKSLRLKYIDNIAEGTERFFDLQNDPGERSPIDVEPDNAVAIKQQADRIAMIGNTGLHLLITHNSAETEQIRGVMRAQSLGDVALRYPDSLSNLTRTSDTQVEFAATFPAVTNSKVPSAHWQEAMKKNESLREMVDAAGDAAKLSEQNYAELVADVPLTATIDLELFIGDAPFPVDHVVLGDDERTTGKEWGGGAIKVVDLVAPPVAFDPAALPVRTAAYLWYVPGGDSLADDDMDPALRESLEALGYIGE